MIILALLIFGFIGIILHLSFAGAEPEVKVAGLTFFISFILVGPIFGGIISIPAPIPMDSENRIEIVSIIVSAALAAIALGIYKVIDNIRYYLRQKKLEEHRKNKKI